MCTIGTVTKNKPSLLCPNSKLYIPSNLSWLVDGKRCSSRLMSICFDAVVPSIEFDSVLFMENWKRNDVLMGSKYCAKCSVLCSRPDREQWRRPMRWRNAVFKWRTRSGTMKEAHAVRKTNDQTTNARTLWFWTCKHHQCLCTRELRTNKITYCNAGET